MSEQTRPPTEDLRTRIAGCSNRDCAVRWPPPGKGTMVTNATCQCVRNLVRAGNWLDLLRALTVRNIEIENLTVQLDAELKYRQENCND